MKLEQFSVIALLKLTTLDISKQWQFSIVISLIIVLNQKSSEPKKCLKLLLMKKTAQLARTLFYQELLINISKHQFHSSINHQEYLFHRTFITNYFCPVNIVKFLSEVFKTFACYFLANFYSSPNDSPSKTMKDVSYFI